MNEITRRSKAIKSDLDELMKGDWLAVHRRDLKLNLMRNDFRIFFFWLLSTLGLAWVFLYCPISD